MTGTPLSGARVRLWSIIIGCGVVLLLLIWQLWTLSPKQWCNSAIDQSKITGEGVVLALKACLDLQQRILGIKDHAIIGLIGAVIVTNLLFMVSEFRMKASVTGPGGTGATLGNDSVAGQAADTVAGAAVDAAAEVKGQQ